MKKILLSLLFICIIFSSFSQILDKVVAVIGDEIVLQSDIETQYLQYLSQGYTDKEEIKCQMTEDILYQKLLAHQAKLDSIDISEDEVNKELERRLSSFISELGSQDALEKYFGKSIIDIKGEFYDVIYNQLLSQRINLILLHQ